MYFNTLVNWIIEGVCQVMHVRKFQMLEVAILELWDVIFCEQILTGWLWGLKKHVRCSQMRQKIGAGKWSTRMAGSYFICYAESVSVDPASVNLAKACCRFQNCLVTCWSIKGPALCTLTIRNSSQHGPWLNCQFHIEFVDMQKVSPYTDRLACWLKPLFLKEIIQQTSRSSNMLPR